LPDPSLSHVAGATEPPLLELTIGAALDVARERWGDREALVDCAQRRRFSWADLADEADRVAAGLIALGLQPGDRIGIWSLNRWEWPVTQLAAARAGLIFVTINPAYRLFEVEYVLNKVGCVALIISPPFRDSDYPGMIAELGPGSSRLPALRHVIEMGDGFTALADMAAPEHVAELRRRQALIRPGDATNIQFTSGTTGSPKGVTLSHRNILNNGYFTGQGIRLTEQDRVCIPVPLYHCFGMVMGNLAALTSGAAMVYPGEGFCPLKTLETVAGERCTALYGVPTMFIAELEHERFAEFDLSSLRTGIMAGSACPIELMRKVNHAMNMGEITICYGMTETSPVSFQSAVDDSLERRCTTVGRIHRHVESKIVDGEGNTVPRGERGELCTRGYSVMLGYWDDPEQTAEAVDAEGWMHTGDLATIDGAGYANIVGRIKDMVIRGGENLYPREIEEFLYRHPAIRDVQLFGVADDKYGEELCAWVILHEGHDLCEERLRDYCRGQIAHQKIPRYVRFVTEFPLTVTGKVKKFEMRAAMEKELGLKPAATA
jgi:fatty-acyl-CoA synthase